MEDKKVELDVKKIKELSKGRADYNSLRISGKIKPYPCQRFPDEESYKKWVRYQPQPVLSYHGDFDPEKSEDIWVVEIAGIVPSNPYILRGYLDEF